MKILIIGGVAAGTKTAAKLKREDRNIDVTVITKDKDISYAGCGLPYYVGGLIEGRDELIVNTPQKYSALTGVEVRTGKEAVAEAKKGKPDLIILDVMLPDKDGFSLMEQLRSFTDVPIIFLTAKDEAADKLAGLGLGADDYIVKPFLPQELILRIYAVLRRSYKEDNPLVVLDGCTVDFDRAEVYKENEIFFLTAKEHMLLKTLARNEGKIITVDALCEALWGDNPFGYGNSLLAHIRRIREKIEITPSKPKSLITVKGLGYKINVESRL